MEVVVANEGFSQAWLMATLGNKATKRKTLKKDLIELSIPNVCQSVSGLPGTGNRLRLSSNLLYGLALIYRHKVSYMASDVESVFDRIKTYIPTATQATQLTVAQKSRVPRGLLTDDPHFDIQTDFAPLCVPSLETLGLGDLPDLNLLNRLFAGDVTRDHETSRISQGEHIDVDFEFDLEGNIVNTNGNDAIGFDILDLLNLEQDLQAVSGTIEDISKTTNSVSNDQHVSMLNQSQATVMVKPSEPPHKRRKRSLVIDERTTILFARSRDRVLKGFPLPTLRNTLESILATARTSSAFVSLCHDVAMSPVSTAQFVHMLKGKPKAIDVQLEMLAANYDEIEEGRNMQSRRRTSLASIPEIGLGFLDDFDPLDLDQNLAPPETFFGDEAGGPAEDEGAKKFEDFKEFLRERATQARAQRPRSGAHPDEALHTFEALVPSQPSTAGAVTRRLAANSFAFMLKLAGCGELQFHVEHDFRPLSLREIYIKLT